MSKKETDYLSEQAPDGLEAAILKRAEPHLEQMRERKAAKARAPWFWASAAGLAAGGLAIFLVAFRDEQPANRSVAHADFEMMQDLEVIRDLEVLRDAKLMEEVGAWKKKKS